MLEKKVKSFLKSASKIHQDKLTKIPVKNLLLTSVVFFQKMPYLATFRQHHVTYGPKLQLKRKLTMKSTKSLSLKSLALVVRKVYEIKQITDLEKKNYPVTFNFRRYHMIVFRASIPS